MNFIRIFAGIRVGLLYNYDMNNASNNSGMTSKQIKTAARKEKASRIRFGQNYQLLPLTHSTANRSSKVKDKQVSAFGTYRESQLSTILKGVEDKYGLKLEPEIYEYSGTKFVTLRYTGRLGINKWAVIDAFIKGINYAQWH